MGLVLIKGGYICCKVVSLLMNKGSGLKILSTERR